MLPKQDISQHQAANDNGRLRSVQPLRAELLAPARAAEIIGPWRALCADLVEENPFFEPWALRPALAAYGRDDVMLACVWSEGDLIGLLPVTRNCSYAKLSIAYWTAWAHPHCYYAAPLVKRGFARLFFEQLFALLCDSDGRESFLQLRLLDGDGALAAVAESAGKKYGRYVYRTGCFERAALLGGADPQAYLRAHVSARKRKELRRQRRRLGEEGDLSVSLLTKDEDPGPWIRDFLALENKGWKGRRGTSLKANRKDAAWFAETLKGAHAAGKLHFVRISCGARAAAMLASFLSGGAGYSLKIAHEPDFARFSPGVLAEIEASKSLLADPDFQFMDSCAAPRHPMIDKLWRGRRAVTRINVSGKGAVSKATLRACRALEMLRGYFPKEAQVRGKANGV